MRSSCHHNGFRARCFLVSFWLFLLIGATPFCRADDFGLLPPGGLLFSGNRGNVWDLYLWKPLSSGSFDLTQLTHTSRPEGNPTYWNRQKLFLCSALRQSGRFGIVAFDVSGKEVWSCEFPLGNLGWPQPSPFDNRILAVLEDPGTGWTTPGIITYPDGTPSKNVPSGGPSESWPSGAGTFQPFPESGLPGGQAAWVDSDCIVLSRVDQQGFDLCARTLSTGREIPLVQGGNNWLVAGNPNGGFPMFFTRRVGQISSIFKLVQKQNDWQYENFTNARQYDWQPAIAPTGDGLVYQSMRDGHFKVFFRSTRTDAIKEIEIPLPDFQGIFHPSWVPPEAFSQRDFREKQMSKE